MKSKNNLVLISIIIILLIIVIGLCGYIFLNNDNSDGTGSENIKENDTTNKENENIQSNDTTTNTTDNKISSVITFDGSKSINSNIKNYTLSCQGNAGIWVTVDSTQKKLTFSYTPTHVVEFYPLNWTSDRFDMEKSDINFDKKIVDVFFGIMGQDSTLDTLFILLEDGTVEYIPIVHMFNNAQGAVISYGKINGINNVVKFTLSDTSNGVTTLAIKSDGSFYDLWYALKDSGKY